MFKVKSGALKPLVIFLLSMACLAAPGVALATWTITSGTTVGGVTYSKNLSSVTGNFDSSGSSVSVVYGTVYEGGTAVSDSKWDNALSAVGSVYSWNLDFSGTSVGNSVYLLNLSAFDAFPGPPVGSSTSTFVYDTTPPEIHSCQVNPNIKVKNAPPDNNVTVEVYAGDVLSPIEDDDFVLSGISASSSTVVTDGNLKGKIWTIDTSVIDPGTYPVTVTVYDAAGNYVDSNLTITVLSVTLGGNGDTDADHIYYYRETPGTPDTFSFTVYGLPAGNYSVAFGREDFGSFTISDVVYGCQTNNWRLAGAPSGSGVAFTTPIINNDQNRAGGGPSPVAVQVYEDSGGPPGVTYGQSFPLVSGSGDLDIVLVNMDLEPPDAEKVLFPGGWPFLSGPPVKSRPTFDSPGLNMKQMNAGAPVAFIIYQPDLTPEGDPMPGGYRATGEIEFAQYEAGVQDYIDFLEGAGPSSPPKICSVFKAMGMTFASGEPSVDVHVYTDPALQAEAQDYLNDKEATIRLFNIKEKFADWAANFSDAQLAGPITLNEAILNVTSVYDDGATAAPNLVDWGTATFVYGENNGTLTLPVAHFTKYEIEPDVSLSNLTISSGTLTPAFDSDVTSYTAAVANSVSTLNVTPTAAAGNLAITINGNAVASGSAQGVSLNVGSNTITVVVTGQGSSTKTYTLTVTRASADGGGGSSTTPQTQPTPTTSTGEVAPTLSTTPDGETDAAVSDAAVQEQLDDGQTALTVDVSTVETPVNVSLSGTSVDAMASGGASLTIDTRWADLTIPAGTLPSGQNVTVSVEPVSAPPNLPSNLSAVGGAVSIEITSGSGNATLHKSVTLIIAYNASAGTDQNSLFVYRINDDGTLTCVGGTAEDGKASVDLSHLSKYAVLAYNSGFSDIGVHWAKRSITFMNARGVVKGVSNTSFQPERAVTRAEFAALMLRTLGIMESRPETPTFTDASADKWYYGAVEAAYEAGLVKGIGEGEFAPERTITREEMAAIVLRVLEKTNASVALADGETAQLLAQFSDNDQIALWAQTSVASAVKAGIIAGNTDGSFAPRTDTTRAVSAVMAERILKATGTVN
ncbi:MAG: S-layer homology domain-containing protein [Bacillota bacterium]